jgi:hypothetical protein
MAHPELVLSRRIFDMLELRAQFDCCWCLAGATDGGIGGSNSESSAKSNPILDMLGLAIPHDSN